MKKLMRVVTTLVLLATTFSVWSETVIIRETPVMLERKGTVYVVPTGSTANYYYYTGSDNVRYVCTATVPAELSTLTPTPLTVTYGTETREVRCYPSSSFVIQAR